MRRFEHSQGSPELLCASRGLPMAAPAPAAAAAGSLRVARSPLRCCPPNPGKWRRSAAASCHASRLGMKGHTVGLFSKAAGIDKRDELTEKAIRDADAHAARGLERYTITVHSTGGGSALLPRLTPFVVEHLQAAGHEVLGVQTDDWAYNAHISCRATRTVQPAVHQPAQVPTPHLCAQSRWTAQLASDKAINESMDFCNYALKLQKWPSHALVRGWVLEPGRVEVAVVVPDGMAPHEFPTTAQGREVEQYICTSEVWQHNREVAACGQVAIQWFDPASFAAEADSWRPVEPQ